MTNVSGYRFITTTGPARIEKTDPDGYRLARKQNGEIILQGAYMWQQGSDYGHEWRDIQTVEYKD